MAGARSRRTIDALRSVAFIDDGPRGIHARSWRIGCAHFQANAHFRLSVDDRAQMAGTRIDPSIETPAES
jgi:hypothetical protein